MMQGKVVLVTGGARGIGRFIAHTFAREGAKLAVADIEPLEKVSAELGEMGADVLAVPADVRDEEQVSAMVQRVADHYGRIDVLVNNAGIVPHFSWGIPHWPLIKDMEKDFWDKVINTNLGGTFLCTKHVLPHMERQRSGHVLNVHGGGGLTSFGTCAYPVSKDAIRTFTLYVAEEEREWNVCVLIVHIGTPIATEEAPEEARQRLASPEVVENRFVLAAKAGMELSGLMVELREGRLVVSQASV